MSSLLNNASLLLNPAGSIISYQEDKIYSVLPKDGTGDFTFSGGDGGTRVNQQGYVEVTPANLAFQSNAFSTSPWSRQNTTLTSGQSDPLGGTNAWKVEFSAAQAYLYQYTAPITGVVTISAYLRADSTTTIGFNDGAGNPNSVTIGTTWQLYTFTYTVSSVYYIIQFDNYFGVSPANQAKTFYVYGAQLNIGSTAKPYQPTTDRLNYPRITYQNGRGALLSEPQRTNVNTYSQDFTNAVWGKYSVTVTGSAAISPDGTMNATKLVVTATSGEIGTSAPVSNGYTTIFAKAGNVGRISLYRGNTSFGTEFNLYNGTIISGTGTIEPYKDGWYRIGVKMDANRSINPYFAGGYAVGDYVYIWGAQSEEGDYPTSYIPTTSATVTRPTDSTSNATSFQTSGVASNGTWSMILQGSEVTLTTQGFQFYSGGTYLGGHYGSTFIVINSSGGETYPFSLTQPRFKIGMSWNGTTLNIYQNGISVASTTNVLSAYNTFSGLLLYNGGGSKLSYPQAAIYNTALSTTQLQELTTVRSGSGGTISYYGPYTIHTFTGSATFTPSFNGEVEVLVVAGGGGGGTAADSFWEGGGGGGAGGLLYASSYGVSQGTGITVTVGAGGAGGLNATVYGGPRSGNGSNSVFGGLTALGGGGGAGAYYSANTGGSGGGGEGYPNASAFGAAGTPGQGNAGGNGSQQASLNGSGGGGGGAGAAGSNALTSSPYTAGDGGDGLPYSISGFSTYYAGGGGGKAPGNAGPTIPGGVGGLGGGGNGGVGGGSAVGASGVNYTGGGGGGGLSTTVQTGNGGTGVVIVRYLT